MAKDPTRVNGLMLELMCDNLSGEAIIDAFTDNNITVSPETSQSLVFPYLTCACESLQLNPFMEMI